MFDNGPICPNGVIQDEDTGNVVAGWVGTAGPSPSFGSFVGVANDQSVGQDGSFFGYVKAAAQETAAANRAIVTAGTSYTLSFLAKYDNVGTNSAVFSLNFYDNNSAYVPLASSPVVVATTGLVMQEFSVTGVAPVGATFASARYESGGQFVADRFAITANPVVVPEAGALPLLATGIIGLCGAVSVARRRK